MGKRSDFERVERDFYPTPASATFPLVPHLPAGAQYIEPCAGDGQLIYGLMLSGFKCLDAYDVEPRKRECLPEFNIRQADMFDVPTVSNALYIVNPPWRRDILHPLIEHLTSALGSRCWLLFDADWVHTKQAIPYLPRLRKIVSVGRVRWIPDSKMTGKDNCAWHLFSQPSDEPAQFYGRK